MVNPKSPGAGDELSPEQQKFKEVKQQQSTSDAAGGSEFRGDGGEYLKSGRQQKEEVKTAKKAATPKGAPVSRREFLNYAWGAALGVVVIEAGLASLFFALPLFKEGEFGGVFPVAGATVPPADAPPQRNLDGQFWLSNDTDGVRALYRVCTHLGCLYEWKDQTVRFECPCHGSKFEKDGKFIEGPAPRSLDQFQMTMLVGGQATATTTEGGQALPFDAAAEYQVDTGIVLKGPSN